MVAPIGSAPRKPRRKRSAGPSVPLKARVTPDHKELAERGAKARGVTLARYVELLIEGDEIARNFEPPSVDDVDKLSA
ncbi:hypothetical protein ACFYTC_48510 [Actinomadura nitritigenes]|uniref:hypothetical protein n=1 Tax=Actinomadura nitritigenes TaxID=134602 RepID=UPI0036BDDB71